MHKLATAPSKAKTRALARTAVALACMLPSWTWAADIVIRSGEGVDTVMQVGPRVGESENDGDMRIESDPDNGTLMQVTPQPAGNDEGKYQGPVLIVPEIRKRVRK